MIAPTEQRLPASSAVDFGLELMRLGPFGCPHPLLHHMRRVCPVHYSAARGAWLVTRHDDVVGALRDGRLGAG
jgi:hypothetical protein